MISINRLVSFVILSLIDGIERLSRITLIYCALHIALTRSGYRGTVDQYWSTTEQSLLWLMLAMFIIFMMCSVFQHLYLQLGFSFLITTNTKHLYQSIYDVKVLPKIGFQKFVIFGSTILQYIFLVGLLLVLQYWQFAFLSILIILLCYIVTYYYFSYLNSTELLAPQLGQTILILIHIISFLMLSFAISETIDIILIIWLFALRLSLLYTQQLIHVYIIYRSSRHY